MLTAHHVLVHGRHSDLLPLTDVRAEPGEVTLVVGDGEQRRTTLALVLSGRMRPDEGGVTWQHTNDVASVRHHVGLVDAVDVNEPEPHQRVSGIIGEDLALLPGPWWRRPKVAAWAADHGHADVLECWTEQLEPDRRLRLLADLALADERVDTLVFDSPDRLTADDDAWLTVLADYALRGVTVIAIVGIEPPAWQLPLQRLGEVFMDDTPGGERVDMPDDMPDDDGDGRHDGGLDGAFEEPDHSDGHKDQHDDGHEDRHREAHEGRHAAGIARDHVVGTLTHSPLATTGSDTATTDTHTGIVTGDGSDSTTGTHTDTDSLRSSEDPR